MGAKLTIDIPYEVLVKLVDQLPAEKKRELTEHLQQRLDERQQLSAEEKEALLQPVQIQLTMNEKTGMVDAKI